MTTTISVVARRTAGSTVTSADLAFAAPGQVGTVSARLSGATTPG
jgi:hypothetical protein